MAALAPPTGPALGHRRNHAKGICFTGMFEANGAGSALSQAQVFTRGQYPVLGRFNLGTPDPNAPDATVRVRGIGLQFLTPDGQTWRSAMIDLPFFPVATPEAFYELLVASGSKDPDAMKTFAGAHPEIGAFGAWAKSAPVDRQLRGRAVQQHQQLHLHRQFRQGQHGAMVDRAGGAAGPGLA
ncbi:MAG: catalase [Acetobacteraceae bacterium]